jgi:hypothetical protein|tara:strand:- start:845 stop:1048 length:204 start_codon:yes stop_codon:yes gene_type:complete
MRGPKTWPSEVIITKGHWAAGTEWNAIGSKGDQYTIKLTDAGWQCDCPAFRKCKHIKSIEEKFNDDV